MEVPLYIWVIWIQTSQVLGSSLYPQSAFYPQSTVCFLQSKVQSPKSEFYTDQFNIILFQIDQL